MSPKTLMKTDRLNLVPLNVDLVDALIAGDAAELKHATGAQFPAPFELPPLFDRDALSSIRDQIDRDHRGEQSNLLVLQESAEPVGVAGLSPSGQANTLVLGYSVYPAHEGKGYATEAAKALIESARREGLSTVRATIPPNHTPSIRVAEKAGMSKVGTAHDEQAGEVLVYEVATA